MASNLPECGEYVKHMTSALCAAMKQVRVMVRVSNTCTLPRMSPHAISQPLGCTANARMPARTALGGPNSTSTGRFEMAVGSKQALAASRVDAGTA